jgi:RNA polymerase sigma-70 factor (ECF subfamily)
LVRLHSGPLERFAVRLLGGGGDAQDAVQEAFIRLWSCRERWDVEGSVRGLLFTLTRNAALDELRRRRRASLAGRGSAELTEPRPSPTPFEEAWSGELHRMAQEAVSRLPARRQEVFRLVREGGLTYPEVARLLGLSVQTVANHMGLALRDLREALLDGVFAEDSR